MAKNYYFCTECKEKIDGDPYVQKWWSGIDQVEFYHVSCFVVAHRAHLTKRAADSPKAGDSRQPDTVKSESVLPAKSG